MPKISVVIPIYNVEQYLEECINSIRNQSFSDIEIICVNDGSTDKSTDILKELQDKDSRICIISKENSGYGHSVNVGINAAKGKYLCIVESDDYVDNSMLETFFEIMEQNALDVLKADSRTFIREDGKDIFTYRKVVRKDGLYNKIIHQEDYERKFDGYVYTWAGMYKLDFLNKYEIRHHESSGASYQDNGFWFQTSMYANRLMFINHAFYNLRRDNPNSSFFSKGKVFAMCDEYDFIYEKIIDAPLKNKKVLFELCFYHRYINYIWTMNRIDPQFLPDFYIRIKGDFKKALSKGEIDSDRFNGSDWRFIFSVLHDDIPQRTESLITSNAVYMLNNAANIYIYGAGMYGKKVYNVIKEMGLRSKIGGFVVTEKESQEYLNDLPIIEINNYDWEANNILILAMNGVNKDAVMQQLHSANRKADMMFTNEFILTEMR